MPLVYDASALLCVVFTEPGAEVVLECLALPGGEISAANLAEVGTKMVERGVPPDQMRQELAAFALDVMPLDEAQALVAASLRTSTRYLGLSLGDRCCLSLAQARGATVVTADRTWKTLKDFDVKLVR